MGRFLQSDEIVARSLDLTVSGLKPESLFIADGNLGLEVAVLSAPIKPSRATVEEAYITRRANRASPVLIVVLSDEGAFLCGASGDNPPVLHIPDVAQAERLCRRALSFSDRNAAISFVASAAPTLETKLPGIVNEGLLSLHELTDGRKGWSGWRKATEKAQQALAKYSQDPIAALGYRSERLDNLTDLLLTQDGRRTALAVLLREGEVPENSTGRFNNTSPVSYALTRADKENLPWVLMVQEDKIRLYSTRNIGVGRRGRTETYVECQTSLLSTDDIGLLWSLFSADALKDNGTVSDILENSKRFAADTASLLRERIYDTVVPQLAMGITEARKLKEPTPEDLALTYEMALTVLFRLLFIAYAEDRDLLPYKSNEAYRKRSLKRKAEELAEVVAEGRRDDDSAHHWTEASELWRAVSNGNDEWGVPVYNGAMFSEEASISKAGAELAKITLPNRYFGQALQSLLLTESPETPYAPIDFRELSVREFGTIYEGLLESELSLAEQDLTRDKKDTYMPAKNKDEVEVEKGAIYLHNRSGARKSSGSYYTRDFAVEHLLDGALKPALKKHLERLANMGEADQAEQFFNFRVADIAMGSGHFLVAAIDCIEQEFALWLEENRVPAIIRELEDLREAAKKALGKLADQVEIEDGQLLRRMIAKRCIYGVDLNPLAVQLSRLSIWIHTFVPGLPLSLLDHNLVHGNALVGIGTMDEIEQACEEENAMLFKEHIIESLREAQKPLQKLAKISDASLKDIESGRDLIKESRSQSQSIKDLCDLIISRPVSEDEKLRNFDLQNWKKDKDDEKRDKEYERKEYVTQVAAKILLPFHALHFPIAFPEVFLDEAPGFNVILGNPPWEKVTIEERGFWARHFPGLRGISQREFEQKKKEIYKERPDLVAELESEQQRVKGLRKVLHANPSLPLGSGDPDLFKAFVWRFWHLTAGTNGRIGVVLPRSAFVAKGSEDFRKEVFKVASVVDITALLNTKRWAFDMEPRYTVVLACLEKGKTSQCKIFMRGPFDSPEMYEKGRGESVPVVTTQEILSWTDSASLPLLPESSSIEVFRQLRQAPRLEDDDGKSWRAKPHRELDATQQKDLMDLESEECPNGFWPVYKGESFDLWTPDTGKTYAWADPDDVLPWLQGRRSRGNQFVREAPPLEYFEGESALPPLQPRIAFRDITNRTNSRTVIASLIPPKTFVTHKGPVIPFLRGDKKDEAYLLGILSSIPLDWYARRWVELNLSFFLFNSLPIPRPERDDPLWRRVVELAGRLASPDDRFAEWAKAVGVECGPVDSADKQDKIHELDAVVAHLYGLSEEHLTHIFETFREGWDYKNRLKEVLKYYKQWRKRK